MNKAKLLEITAFAGVPLGNPFLDGLFDLAPTAVYYRFLYHLAGIMHPSLVVELGVCTGRSTAHLAAGCPSAKIIGIDSDPQVFPDVAEIRSKYKNIILWKMESTHPSITDHLIADGSVDLCFVDSLHTYEQVTKEFQVWLPKMKPGGVMLFDDISGFPGMDKAWAEITAGMPEEKFVSLPQLHHSGFGAIITNPDIQQLCRRCE